MGTFLESMYGIDYVPVGLSFGSGSFQAKYGLEEGDAISKRILKEFSLSGSRHDSFSQLFDRVDSNVFALDLRAVKDPLLPRWMKQRHYHRTIGAIFQPSREKSESYYERLILPHHFEAVIHVRKTNAAVPLGPTPKVNFGARLSNSNGDSGAIIQSIADNSLAKRCGLQKGDRIEKFGNSEIKSNEDFQRTLSSLQRGGTIEIEIVRDALSDHAKPMTLYVILPPWVGDNSRTRQ